MEEFVKWDEHTDKEQNPFHFMVQINISSQKLSLVPCNIKLHDIMYTVRNKK